MRRLGKGREEARCYRGADEGRKRGQRPVRGAWRVVSVVAARKPAPRLGVEAQASEEAAFALPPDESDAFRSASDLPDLSLPLPDPLSPSARLRFLPDLKSVSYQPFPFNRNWGAETRLRSDGLPQSG